MRILRNCLMLVLPLLIFINLYRFVVIDQGVAFGQFEYRGFHYLFERVSTFNGLTHTLETFTKIKDSVDSYMVSYVNVVDLITFFEAFGNFFKLVGTVLMIPVWLSADIILDIMWFIDIFAI